MAPERYFEIWVPFGDVAAHVFGCIFNFSLLDYLLLLIPPCKFQCIVTLTKIINHKEKIKRNYWISAKVIWYVVPNSPYFVSIQKSLCPTTALSKYFLETSFVNTRIPYNIFYKTFDCVRLSYHPIMLPERMFLGNSGDSCLIISSKKSTII